MHRTQILLEEDQYQRLKRRSMTTGTAIGELVRRAVDTVYGVPDVADQLRALDESFGVAEPDDFDGLDGMDYVDRVRKGFDHRLRAIDGA